MRDVVVVRDGEVEQGVGGAVGLREFVMEFEDGSAYTVFRTFRDGSVVAPGLDWHVARLDSSLQEACPGAARISAASVRAVLHTALAAARPNTDLTICIVASAPTTTQPRTPPALHAHISPLRSHPPAVPTALVRGGRAAPRAKDVAWVRARRELEGGAGAATAGEVVMVGEDGRVLEGLTSNVFVVGRGGEVWTAEEGVLMGHVREMVVRACEGAGLELVRSGARVGEAECEWKEMFITSGTRMIVAVESVILSDGETRVAFDPVPGPVTSQLMRQLAKTIDEVATPI